MQEICKRKEDVMKSAENKSQNISRPKGHLSSSTLKNRWDFDRRERVFQQREQQE